MNIETIKNSTKEIGFDGGCGTCPDCQEGFEERRASTRKAQDETIFVILTVTCEECGTSEKITQKFLPNTYTLAPASYCHGSYGGLMVIPNK